MSWVYEGIIPRNWEAGHLQTSPGILGLGCWRWGICRDIAKGCLFLDIFLYQTFEKSVKIFQDRQSTQLHRLPLMFCLLAFPERAQGYLSMPSSLKLVSGFLREVPMFIGHLKLTRGNLMTSELCIFWTSVQTWCWVGAGIQWTYLALKYKFALIFQSNLAFWFKMLMMLIRHKTFAWEKEVRRGINIEAKSV